MLTVGHINKRFTIGKHDPTPEQIARQCLAAARSDPGRAIALARRCLRGAQLRATLTAIASALLRHGRPA
jgi:hypothetical protein